MTAPTELTLREVADWQLAPEKTNKFRVELPKLQRGFVWEPAKVADLWDSVLRGFPIGSMMISTIDPEPSEGAAPTHRFWLLDGQQRATSIAIGFYNPWNHDAQGRQMWHLKQSIPILWLDLEPTPQKWDVKKFFPYLVTQSHPWGYNQDGGVIRWDSRRKASEAFDLGANYSSAELSRCFPWETKLPFPLSILLEIANREGLEVSTTFWAELGKVAENFVPAWKSKFGERMKGEPPQGLDNLLQRLCRVPPYHVHLNLLTGDAAENDAYTADDNSLLFVRLNTGGVLLGGEELIFSLFKSAFPLAKDAVEECAAGFMAPSKLFGLLVRLATAEEAPGKLARPVSLGEFKKDIRPPKPLKRALEDLIHKEHKYAPCEAARLMAWALSVLCGTGEPALSFCLPQAVATRTINESPDVFLALLYWRRKGGEVEIGSVKHRDLLGRFTALSWFLPGNARAKQDALRDWVAAAGEEIVGRLWSGECLGALFTRSELAIPIFPPPQEIQDILLKCVVEAEIDSYANLADYAAESFWDDYAFLPGDPEDTDETRRQRLGTNLKSFADRLYPCRTMLLYAQRDYIRKRFGAFGQWELTLKDTNCPWDWDHIYPSASGLHNVDPVYKGWHDTIGNLRAEGLSENRRDGCNTPADKLALTDQEGTPVWRNSAITEEIWKEMQTMGYQQNAIKKPALAREICAIVLKRMASIYGEWHEQLRIGPLMHEIRSIASEGSGGMQAGAQAAKNGSN